MEKSVRKTTFGEAKMDEYRYGQRSNMEAAYKALASYGAPLAGFSTDDLQDSASEFESASLHSGSASSRNWLA